MRNPPPILHSVLAILILLVATVLAIYKPQGVTPYGARKEPEPQGGVGEPNHSRQRR